MHLIYNQIQWWYYYNYCYVYVSIIIITIIIVIIIIGRRSLSSFWHRVSLLAATAPHSRDWLLALPICSCGLRLDDEAVRVAVGIRLAIQYRYSDAIRRFNSAKDGEAFLFLPDCNACVSHIRYLFICSEARRRITSSLLRRGQLQRNQAI